LYSLRCGRSVVQFPSVFSDRLSIDTDQLGERTRASSSAMRARRSFAPLSRRATRLAAAAPEREGAAFAAAASDMPLIVLTRFAGTAANAAVRSRRTVSASAPTTLAMRLVEAPYDETTRDFRAGAKIQTRQRPIWRRPPGMDLREDRGLSLGIEAVAELGEARL
jgi:hypothetical protein